MLFDTLEDLIVATAEGVRPPERLTVSEAAAKYRHLENRGAYVGPWDNSITPYLIEPMDVLTSVSYTAMILAGPAQCGKTDMFLNWLTHSIICDPADMMLIEKAQATARDFSIRRVDRLHRHNPEVGNRLIMRRDADNTFDKQYASGMMLNLSWPTINELSGRPIPRLWLTDYDRMPEDIDDEGSPFDLARKRATTFRSHGMTVAESSPGYEITDPKWQRKTVHEAPPTRGILSLYNRGDRRRWYWKCVACHLLFEPDFSLLDYPKTGDAVEAGEAATLICPHCGQVYTQTESAVPGRTEMNINGQWLKDGQSWDEFGNVIGTGTRSDIASFWLKGVAAALVDWKTLVINYRKAEQEYEDTGSETALKTTVNVDQALPYVPKSQVDLRSPDDLKARARELGQKVVPFGVRFLVATVDVQKNRFVVQVHGIGSGADVWLVDRFEIKKSRRRDPEQEDGVFWVNPGAYPEDWKLLVPEVITKTYPLADGSGRVMAIKQTVCDSGGRAGVTPNAYNFFRWLRRGDGDAEEGLVVDDDESYGWVPGLAARFLLLKGDPNENAPRVRLGHPDSQRKDRHAGARGEIPVLFINVDMLKDTLNTRLDRLDPMGGRINFPNWLGPNFYAELCVEIKDPKKGWINPKNYRNESWDLLVYLLAALQLPQISVEYIEWDAPKQGWVKDWDHNDLVYDPAAENKPFDNKRKRPYDLAALANRLA